MLLHGLLNLPAASQLRPAGRTRRPAAAVGDLPRPELVAGIDLGTTNSAIAYVEAGKPRCIPNADGELTTPSVVAILPGGEVLVGRKAKRQAAANPGITYYSVKRLIGREFDDEAVQQEIPRLAYTVRASSWGSPAGVSTE
jgi:molecular chaperone DnaK